MIWYTYIYVYVYIYIYVLWSLYCWIYFAIFHVCIYDEYLICDINLRLFCCRMIDGIKRFVFAVNHSKIIPRSTFEERSELSSSIGLRRCCFSFKRPCWWSQYSCAIENCRLRVSIVCWIVGSKRFWPISFYCKTSMHLHQIGHWFQSLSAKVDVFPKERSPTLAQAADGLSRFIPWYSNVSSQ